MNNDNDFDVVIKVNNLDKFKLKPSKNISSRTKKDDCCDNNPQDKVDDSRYSNSMSSLTFSNLPEDVRLDIEIQYLKSLKKHSKTRSRFKKNYPNVESFHDSVLYFSSKENIDEKIQPAYFELLKSIRAVLNSSNYDKDIKLVFSKAISLYQSNNSIPKKNSLKENENSALKESYSSIANALYDIIIKNYYNFSGYSEIQAFEYIKDYFWNNKVTVPRTKTSIYTVCNMLFAKLKENLNTADSHKTLKVYLDGQIVFGVYYGDIDHHLQKIQILINDEPSKQEPSSSEKSSQFQAKDQNLLFEYQYDDGLIVRNYKTRSVIINQENKIVYSQSGIVKKYGNIYYHINLSYAQLSISSLKEDCTGRFITDTSICQVPYNSDLYKAVKDNVIESIIDITNCRDKIEIRCNVLNEIICFDTNGEQVIEEPKIKPCDCTTNERIEDFLKALVNYNGLILGKSLVDELGENGFEITHYDGYVSAFDGKVFIYDWYESGYVDYISYPHYLYKEEFQKCNIDGKKTYIEWISYFKTFGFDIEETERILITDSGYISAKFNAICKTYKCQIRVKFWSKADDCCNLETVELEIDNMSIKLDQCSPYPFYKWFESDAIESKILLDSNNIELSKGAAELQKLFIYPLGIEGYTIDEMKFDEWKSFFDTYCEKKNIYQANAKCISAMQLKKGIFLHDNNCKIGYFSYRVDLATPLLSYHFNLVENSEPMKEKEARIIFKEIIDNMYELGIELQVNYLNDNYTKAKAYAKKDNRRYRLELIKYVDFQIVINIDLNLQ